MRLLKLKVRNIASLRGEHLIDFADIQRHSPLFAITGETGAGKSTILNSIGLALYGRLFKTSLQSSDVITLGEKDGQIDLILTVKGKNYLATWRIRVRKQNGEPYATTPSATRELYELQGDDFDAPKRISAQEAGDILNLDFDQFTKCVILNQGEFARFLNSSFTDRKDILEKMYPGEVLENLSRTLRLELGEIERNLGDLEINLSTLEGESLGLETIVQELGSLKLKLAEKETIDGHLSKTKFHFTSLLSSHKNHQDISRKITLSKNDLSELTTKQNTFLLEVRKNEEAFLEAQRQELQERPKLLELLEKEKEVHLLQERQRVLEKKIQDHAAEEKVHQEKKRSRDLKGAHLREEKEKLLPSLRTPFDELKKNHRTIEEIFERFHEFTLAERDVSSSTQKLKEIEQLGKESAKRLDDLRAEVSKFPAQLEQNLLELQKQKQKNQELSEQKQKALLKFQSLSEEMKSLQSSQAESAKRIEFLQKSAEDFETEKKSLEATLQMGELLEAVEVCLTHVEDSCPVCHSSLDAQRIQTLKKDLKKVDPEVRVRLRDVSKLLLKTQEETSFLTQRLQDIQRELLTRSQTQKALEPEAQKELPSLSDIDSELSSLQKKIWDREKLLLDEKRLALETQTSRTQYREIKSKLAALEKDLTLSQEKISQLSQGLSVLFPQGVGKEVVALLKQELKTFKILDENEKLIEKNLQESAFEEKVYGRFLLEKNESTGEHQRLSLKITELGSDLKTHLGPMKASEKLSELSTLVKKHQDQWKACEDLLKAEQLKMKEIQGRLYNYEELKKDFEIRFSQEAQSVRAHATQGRAHSGDIFLSLSTLSVDLETPEELLSPLETHLLTHESELKKSLLDFRDRISQLNSQKEASEKRQDKMALLILKKKEILEKFNRLARLENILGKDELRTFVLALVEENLITQTNKELELLCQGRYEIVHQTRGLKMAPEFFILDKFREGGLRKVSTLSGGETFMVSLAMALGLAEMTRGQAEIDSLFIDEGFGTLDQDSLTDVLEVLNQIQTRGLMVGIISHIKTLTQSLPVNLLLSKRTDGTSSIKVTYN
jgi:DNA repair protein SbcC/Rad50